MIKTILIPNLERRTDRKFLNLGALSSQFVPPDIIKYFPAKDGQAFHNVKQMVIQARQDGIPISTQYDDMGAWGINTSYFGWQWTWAAMLKGIIDSDSDDETLTLILIDDWFLRCSFWEIQQLAGDAAWDNATLQRKEHYNRFILQLHWTSFGDNPVVPRHTMSHIPVYRGFKGSGDQATILNKGGAQVLLNIWAERPHEPPERHFWYLAQRKNQFGFYSAMSSNDYVHTFNPALAKDDRE